MDVAFCEALGVVILPKSGRVETGQMNALTSNQMWMRVMLAVGDCNCAIFKFKVAVAQDNLQKGRR